MPLTFPNIRGRLAKETGNEQVTVPTMVTEDGFVTDSWEIAQWVSDCGGVLASPGRTPRSLGYESCQLGGRMPCEPEPMAQRLSLPRSIGPCLLHTSVA